MNEFDLSDMDAYEKRVKNMGGTASDHSLRAMCIVAERIDILTNEIHGLNNTIQTQKLLMTDETAAGLKTAIGNLLYRIQESKS